ncbi:MAG TPA: hypothetical protein VLC98_16490 [Phnomibacter sp.]|nr:hypothetical protein [Phnomibacter sp.]
MQSPCHQRQGLCCFIPRLAYLSQVKLYFNKTFFIAGLLAILMYLVMAIQGAALKTAATPCGILNLEFAGKYNRVEEVVKAWRYLNNTALWNTLIDFGFLAAYTFFFARGTQYLSTCLPGSSLLKYQPLLQKTAFLPGLFDVVENGFMLGWLLNIVPAYSPELVYVLVWIKFILAAILFLVCFPAWIFNTYQFFKKKMIDHVY